MIVYAGIDDTDTIETRGTNYLARRIAKRLPPSVLCEIILRHQLFFDPRVPYTSHNGSASLRLSVNADEIGIAELIAFIREEMCQGFVEGSDPGLCVAPRAVDPAVIAFAQRCQNDVVRQDEARQLATAHGIHLEGLGGTEDGVIGALAAVGLAATGNDGRVVHLAGWSLDDPLMGMIEVATILRNGIDEVREAATGAAVTQGVVELRKKLRPNIRAGRLVLFVERASESGAAAEWRALKVV
jgi:hypothetical protein